MPKENIPVRVPCKPFHDTLAFPLLLHGPRALEPALYFAPFRCGNGAFVLSVASFRCTLRLYKLAPELVTLLLVLLWMADWDDYGDLAGFFPPTSPSSRQDLPYGDDVDETPEAPIQDRARWRCLKCASFDASWIEDRWCCTTCGSTDFYQVNQPTRQMTPEGTWLYVPNGGQADRTPRQWRRRQRRSGPPSDSQSELGERHPESETRTFDPAIDPDAPVNVASQPVDHQGDPPLPHLPPGSRGLPEQSPLSTVRDPLMKELRKLVTGILEKGPDKGLRWRTGQAPTPPSWR